MYPPYSPLPGMNDKHRHFLIFNYVQVAKILENACFCTCCEDNQRELTWLMKMVEREIESMKRRKEKRYPSTPQYAEEYPKGS